MPDTPENHGPTDIPDSQSGTLSRQPAARPGFIEAFSAFSHRNYRIFFSGQMISLIGLPEFKPRPRAPFFKDIHEAYSYILAHGPLRAIMILVSTFSMFGFGFTILMPVFARDVLHGDAQAFGTLLACNGLGALVGGLSLAAKAKAFQPRTPFYTGIFGCCILLSLFAFSEIFWLSAALLFFAGFFMIIFLATANTATQLRSPVHLRGRIMGFYSLCFLGMSSVGGLLTGWLAKHLGAPNAILLGMAVCLATALVIKGRIIPSPDEQVLS